MIKKAEWIGLSALSLILLVFALNWAVKLAVHSQKDVVVPDMTGQSLYQALDVLSKLSLGLKQEGAEYNDKVPGGTVLRQQPPAGMAVREGKIIRVTLSQGGETIFIPDLSGQSLRSAEIALRLNNLSLGEVRGRPSLKYEKDIVVTQDPAPKTVVRKNALVHLIVSEGPPPQGVLLMPDFAGKKLDEAAEWAEGMKIKIETASEESPLEDGTVLAQSVAADDMVQNVSSVRFTIAKKASGAAFEPQSPAAKFRFEVPQGEAGKKFRFVLVDGSKSKDIWNGEPDPGSKLDIPLPEKPSPSGRVRIFVNGILTEESPAQ